MNFNTPCINLIIYPVMVGAVQPEPFGLPVIDQNLTLAKPSYVDRLGEKVFDTFSLGCAKNGKFTNQKSTSTLPLVMTEKKLLSMKINTVSVETLECFLKLVPWLLFVFTQGLLIYYVDIEEIKTVTIHRSPPCPELKRVT